MFPVNGNNTTRNDGHHQEGESGAKQSKAVEQEHAQSLRAKHVKTKLKRGTIKTTKEQDEEQRQRQQNNNNGER